MTPERRARKMLEGWEQDASPQQETARILRWAKRLRSTLGIVEWHDTVQAAINELEKR